MESLAIAAIAQDRPDLAELPLQSFETSLETLGQSVATTVVLTSMVATSTLIDPGVAEAVIRRTEACPASTIRNLQTALVNRGYAVGPVDGLFGGKTEFAVVRFQQDRRLTANGIVESGTLSALGLNPLLDCQQGGSGGGWPPGTAVRVNTNGGDLYLRNAPRGAVIGSFANGTPLTVLETREEWIRVAQGWVATAWLVQTNGNNPTPGSPNQVEGTGNIPCTPTTKRGRVRSPLGLNARSAPNGEIVEILANETEVCLTGELQAAGNLFWAKIGEARWVAVDYIEPLGS